MLLVLYEKETGKIHAIIPNGEKRGSDVYVGQAKVVHGTILEAMQVPDQDTSHLYDRDGVLRGTINDLIHFTQEELKALVDRETAQHINSTMHPFTPIEEQIGILREQIVQILNALGIEPTPEFARLNEVAIQAIEKARKLKEGLYAENNSTS